MYHQALDFSYFTFEFDLDFYLSGHMIPSLELRRSRRG
jgi:hypothetical protein